MTETARKKTTLMLGIESSCDETAVALVRSDRTILGQKLYSQIDMHVEYGGVVPEIASRKHQEHIRGLLEGLLVEAGVTMEDIDAISFTGGPGLIGGVLVGSMFAKGLSMRFNKPLLPINHLAAHALTARLEDPDLPFPFWLLLISGGHTQILFVENVDHYHLIGQTLDDSLGECFDKTAKMLDMPYPGGPKIEKMAALGDAHVIQLPAPMVGRDNANFSFSGLKTAVRKVISDHKEALKGDVIGDAFKADLSASFQHVIARILVDRLTKSLSMGRDKGLLSKHLVVAGGVAANQAIKQSIIGFTVDQNMKLYVPSPSLCTDNAIMVAWAGIEHWHSHGGHIKGGVFEDPLAFDPKPRWPL